MKKPIPSAIPFAWRCLTCERSGTFHVSLDTTVGALVRAAHASHLAEYQCAGRLSLHPVPRPVPAPVPAEERAR